MSLFLTSSRSFVAGLIGGVGAGAVGATTSALTTFFGSKILATGHTNEIVQMSAAGGALLNGAMGLTIGMLFPLMSSNEKPWIKPERHRDIFLLTMAWHLFSQPLSATLGHALFLEATTPVATLGETIASAATGMPLTLAIATFLVFASGACCLDFWETLFCNCNYSDCCGFEELSTRCKA